jgi:hypothetical protein
MMSDLLCLAQYVDDAIGRACRRSDQFDNRRKRQTSFEVVLFGEKTKLMRITA